MYINDFPKSTSAEIVLFADDTIYVVKNPSYKHIDKNDLHFAEAFNWFTTKQITY